jgi:hypothetical protein
MPPSRTHQRERAMTKVAAAIPSEPNASVPLVFVVGTGRCGTHTLSKVFESLPNTLSTHEGRGTLRSGPASSLGKNVVLGGMLEFNAYLYHHAGEDVFRRTFDPDPAMRGLMDESFAGRARSIAWCEAHGVAYCDANAFGFNFINYLDAKFPNAKFIHLVRDGYACVRSWSQRVASTYPDEIPNALSIEWLLAKPTPFPSDPVHASWTGFDRLQKIAWFWNTVNANIAERLARIPPTNKRVVKIEEVTEATMPNILDFCGLPQQYSRDALAPDDRSSGSAIEWTADNVRKFNALAAPMMAHLGYAIR